MMIRPIRAGTAILGTLLGLALAAPAFAQSNWADRLRGAIPAVPQPSEPAERAAEPGSVPLEAEHSTLVSGLKEALSKGAEYAIALAGAKDGFTGNPRIRIPMPGRLDSAAGMLRGFGFGRQVDAFELSMNRAAEKAAPQAQAILLDAIRGMSIEDARGVLVGPADGATRYLRRSAGDQIADAFRPIVGESMEETGVTRAYKELTEQVGSRVPGLSILDDLDLNEYVTTKAMDGIFLLLADQEKKIRQDPAARTTELLREVFGR